MPMIKASRFLWSRNTLSLFILLVLIIASQGTTQAQGDPKLTEVWTPVPPIVNPGNKYHPPSDAIILFDGSSLEAWTNYKNEAPAWEVKDGILTVKPGSGPIKTKTKFASCQLHIEFRSPDVANGEGQGRGNSGVFLQERYEVQVLDSYDNITYSNGQAGSIYKQYIPLVNASRKPGEWQTYDIIFTAPQFNDDGTLKTPAYVTVLHNGLLIQNHVELKGATAYIGEATYKAHNIKESILLQDHGNTVSYRNIWVREIDPFHSNN